MLYSTSKFTVHIFILIIRNHSLAVCGWLGGVVVWALDLCSCDQQVESLTVSHALPG